MSTNHWGEKKQHRNGKYRKPMLTKYDEGCPDTHIPIYVLFSDENSKNLHLPEPKIQELRLSAYDNVLELFDKYQIKEYDVFWNTYIEELTEMGLNSFAKHNKFSPLANLVECFSNMYKCKGSDSIRRAISFGVSKDILNQYIQNVINANENNTELIIPKLKNKPLHKSIAELSADEIILNENGKKNKLTLDRNGVYYQFMDWCKANNLSKKNGISLAIKLLIEKKPAENIKSANEYDTGQLIENIAFGNSQSKTNVNTKILIQKDIYNLSNLIIREYNRDENNVGKNIDFTLYVNNALNMLNKKMDLKYSNPELSKQLDDIQKVVKHNGN